ncbi:MAG TPA: hypothetical protein VH598_15885, partial [Verrucomicrobiae bacterium]|nr:hypothetical protein [Verrucomicrobiae bacterium]
ASRHRASPCARGRARGRRGSSLSGGSGSILGSMIGALIMAILRNGSSQMSLPTYMQEIIIGLVIILAVGLDKLRQRRREF